MQSVSYIENSKIIKKAQKEGINSILQPGGSINDHLSINYCNKYNLSMVFSGIRHFKH